MTEDQSALFYSTPEFQLAASTIILIGLLCMLSGAMGYRTPGRRMQWKYQILQVCVFFGGPTAAAIVGGLITSQESGWYSVIFIASFTASLICMGVTHRICRLYAERQNDERRQFQIARQRFLDEDYHPKVRVDPSEWVNGRWKHPTEESREN